MKNIRRFLKKNSATILTTIGAGGVVATAILAVKETPKAIRLLEEAEKEKGDKLTKLESVVNTVPVYIPAIATGVSTIICIFGANALNKKKQASLISAYNLLANYHKNYKSAATELYGDEVDQKVREKIAENNVEVDEEKEIPYGQLLWYEETSEQTITRYESEIIDAEMRINKLFTEQGYVLLNTWYKLLGLPETEEGKSLGWTEEGGWYYWIDFVHYPINRDEPNPVYCISAPFAPDDLTYVYE